MSNIWSYVLNATIYGSITGIAILIIKTILKNKINKKYAYLLWMILIVKLIIPFGPSSEISLFNKIPIDINEKINIDEINTMDVNSNYIKENQSKTTSSENLFEKESTNKYDDYNTSNKSNYSKIKLHTSIPIIWIIGTLMLLITYTTIYIYFLSKLNANKKLKYVYLDNILESCKENLNIKRKIHIVIDDTISSPSIIGVFKIRIILPYHLINLSEKELKHIFLHELCHYKSKDNVVDTIVSLLQCIHWFNPITWYLFKQIRKDMEMACDEKVLSYLNEEDHNKYGITMLTVLEKIKIKKSYSIGLNMTSDRKTIKQRVELIKNSKKLKSKKKIFTITGVICLILVSSLLLTDKISSESNNSFSYSKEVSNRLDDAISEVIIEKYLKGIEGEFLVESHNILGKKEDKNTIEVYIMATYCVYEFQNNVFNFTTGCSNIPMKIKFSKNKEGEKLKYNTKYSYLDTQTANDGGLFEESLYEIFPKKEAKQALKNIMDNNYPKKLLDDVNNQAKIYAKNLGRECEVTYEYSEKEELDQIIVTEMSNKGEELDKYPQYIGTREILEKGQRYIYETNYDETTGIVSFYKYKENKGHSNIMQYKLNGEDLDKIDYKKLKIYPKNYVSKLIDNEVFDIGVNSISIINNNAYYYVSIKNKTNQNLDVKLNELNIGDKSKNCEFNVKLKPNETKYHNLIIKDVSEISQLDDKIYGDFIANSQVYDFLYK